MIAAQEATPRMIAVMGVILLLGACGACVLVATLFIREKLWPPPRPENPGEAADWPWKTLFLVPLMIALQIGLMAGLAALGIEIANGLQFAVVGVAAALEVAVIWLVCCRSRRKPVSSLGLRRPAATWQVVTAPVAAYALAIGAMIIWASVRIIFLPETTTSVQKALESFNTVRPGIDRVLVGLVVAFVAPIAEEVVFRGYLFRMLRHRWGVAAGVLVSAAVFAAVHGEPLYMPPLFVIGVLLALLVQVTGSLYPAMVLHAIVNGMTVALLI